MSNTEIMPASMAAPDGTATRTVSVLPYAYWPVSDRVAYARTMAGAKELLPAGLRSATPDETAAKVFLVLETGAMLGLHPMAAFQGIDVIEGNATISPQLFTALVRGAGHKLRIQDSGSIAAGDYRVDVTLIRADDPEWPITASWDLQDAVQAGLCELENGPRGWEVRARSRNDNPLNWEKYPKDMCQWRALGRLARRGAADVTMGIGYFPEELEVAVTQDGVREVTDMKPVEDALIVEFRALDDKADMGEVWLREHPKGTDGFRYATPSWTDRVDAEFRAHLATLTKDSRPAKPGAPGQTGDANIDGSTDAEREAHAEQNLAGAEAVEFLQSGEPAPEPMTMEAAATIVVQERPEVESIDDRVAREEAEEAERSAREHEEYLASLEAQPEPEPVRPAARQTPPRTAKPAPGLDMSALGGES